MAKKLSHVDDQGRATMVEVTEKKETVREAVAHGFVQLSQEVLELIRADKLKKGNPIEVARVAGIMAAKQTPALIPLCHPLLLTKVDVEIELTASGAEIVSRVVCVGKTGVEMEALTAVSVAALTLYDMCKAVDKKMVIGEIYLEKKSGGRSGTFVREGA
ncbi:MAG: cyclic pyranopterin monophosphate synthase MoaC [Calditrichaeota bacterium]|nr:MAG: cyclic pyranopterin monophosphate synthase MoaC [Calditrichota bacterium]